MRRKTKGIIITLSVITAVLTATTISVPIVISKVESDNRNSIKNNTIKESVINNEDESAKKFINASSEKEIRDIIDSVSKDKKWDNFFKFTNENDDIVNNIVEEVFFDLRPSVNKPNERLAIFAISFKEDIKVANGANIVRYNVTLDADLTITGDAKIIATNFLAKLFDGKSYSDQKTIYENLVNETPEGFIAEIEKVIKFNNGATDLENVIKNVTLSIEEFPLIAGTGNIPSVQVEVNLNDGYNIVSGNEFLSFTTNTLGLVGEYKISQSDVNNAKEATEEILTSLLDSKSHSEQKVIYEAWSTTNLPVGLEDAIKNSIKLNDLSIVDSITNFELGTFPPASGGNVPGVTITIKLKDGNTNEAGDSSEIKITTDNLGLVGTYKLSAGDNDLMTIAATDTLTKLLENMSFDEQKAEHDSWKNNNLPEGLEDAIKSSFQNGAFIVDTIDLLVTPFPATPGISDVIPGLRITVNFKKGNFTHDDNNFFSIDIANLGPIAIYKIGENEQNKASDDVETLLINLMDLPTYDEQETVYNTWDNDNLPEGLEDAIRKAIRFGESSITGADNSIIQSITFTKKEAALPPGPGRIPGVEIVIALKNGVKTHDDLDSFTIDITDLGEIASTTNP